MNDYIKVICGKCKKEIGAIKLKVPVPISFWDKENNYKREETFNCCKRTWLMTWKDEAIDYGPEILND